MTGWMIQLAFFACGALLSLAVLGLLIAAVMPFADRRVRRFFIVLFTVLIPGMAALLVEIIVFRDPALASVNRAACFCSSVFISIPLPLFTVYLLHSCGETRKGNRFFRTVSLLWILYFIMLIIAQFTTWFYYITPDNQFHLGPWYPLSIAPLVAIMILNFTGVLRRRIKISKNNLHAFLFFLLPLTAGLLIHMFVSNYLFVDIGVTFATLSMFILVLINQSEQYTRQKEENEKQKASIMVLQMRPHFIYNTMTSIYYLCEQDPSKAQQVTMDFTTYLRKNFTAIASENTVLFSEELEHARAYLAVEQAGFEDRLIVEYDTPHTRFRVPPLTLQPIVENAVKHGMDPDSDPLNITIRTRETGSGSEITVEDNGLGFDPHDDNGPHIALANIKQRLEVMCNGKMITASRKEGGTTVTIIIP